MGRLGLSMVRVSVCEATHPCRSRLEGRKSDRTLGGGRRKETVTAPLEVDGVDGGSGVVGDGGEEKRVVWDGC